MAFFSPLFVFPLHLSLLSKLLHGPLLLAERAAVVLLDPEAHAALVEAVVAVAPHHDAVLGPPVSLLLGLATQACVHHWKTVYVQQGHIVQETTRFQSNLLNHWFTRFWLNSLAY